MKRINLSESQLKRLFEYNAGGDSEFLDGNETTPSCMSRDEVGITSVITKQDGEEEMGDANPKSNLGDVSTSQWGNGTRKAATTI